MRGKADRFQRLLVTLSLITIGGLYAGNTGKIVGRIYDQSNGEPLFAANVIVAGTEWGTASGEDGRYFINNIPPGVYTVRGTMIGYKTIDIVNILIQTDLTTEVNFPLELSVLQGEIVTVVAERGLIERDITAKRSIISGQDIAEKIPVTTVQGALATQAGFVEDSDGNLHLRGGRSDEVSYYVDGILVESPIGGGLGAEIDINTVSELSVLTGGFNAEYGEAMSGVVNITTREGGKTLSGKLQFESDMLNESPYHQKDWLLETDLVKGLSEEEKLEYLDAVRFFTSATDSIGTSRYQHVSVLDNPYVDDYLLIPITGRLSGSLSGPVPGIKNLSFFASAFHENHDSYLPKGFRIENQAFEKLTYKLSPRTSLSFNNQSTSRYSQGYSHVYKYIPPTQNDPTDSLNYNTRLLGRLGLITVKTDRQVLTLAQSISSRTFYTINLQRLRRDARRYIPGVNVPYDTETGALFDTVATEYIKLTYIFGSEGEFQGGDDRDWYREQTTTYNIKSDLTSQVNLNHQVKLGFDYKQHDLFRHALRDPWPGAFRHRVEFYERQPWEAAAYIQDKMEFDFMVLNIGLRWDAIQVNDTYWTDPGDIQETVTVDNGDGTVTQEFRFKDQIDVPMRYHLSPRIGLAHPVTEKLVFHFSYGHFFQNPDYYVLYRNDQSLNNLEESDVIIGNPGLKPQKTIAFEVGGKYQVTTNIALDFSGFYKDIYDLTSTKYYSRQPYNYTIYINEDYGRIKGFDVSVNRRHNRFISASAHYTFSVSQGSGSDPLSGYYFREDDANLRPKREYYLNFDRTHDLSANVDLRYPDNFGPSVLGRHPLGNVGVNLLYQMASGLPYTPSYSGSVSLEENSERKGWTNTLDIRVDKTANIGGNNLVLYAKVTNALDNLNTQLVWSETGDPWDAGPTNYRSLDRQANPGNVGPRRDVRLGIYYKF
ncbi:MAG: TonB-dependent receptor [Candidatus Neomarinimicrobiota bacterium]